MARSKRRSQTGRSRRREPATTVEPVAAPVLGERTKLPVDVTEPEPWSTRGLIVLTVLVVVVVMCLAGLGYLSDRRHNYAEYLVGQAYQPVPLLFLLAYLVAMPLAQRLAQQPRPLRVLESLSVGAVAELLVFLIAGAALSATARSGVRAQLAALGLAEIVAMGLNTVIYPSLYRRFWMRRRRTRMR